MVAEGYPPEDVRSPDSLGGTTVQLLLTVPDVDVAVRPGRGRRGPSVEAGGRHPWGERSGKIRDPFGHNWFISTRLDVPA